LPPPSPPSASPLSSVFTVSPPSVLVPSSVEMNPRDSGHDDDVNITDTAGGVTARKVFGYNGQRAEWRRICTKCTVSVNEWLIVDEDGDRRIRHQMPSESEAAFTKNEERLSAQWKVPNCGALGALPGDRSDHSMLAVYFYDRQTFERFVARFEATMASK